MKPKVDFETACAYARDYANRIGGGLESAQDALVRMGYGDSTFGIEYVSLGERGLSYLNTGDTYSTTLGSEDGGDVFVTSWGDWYEEAQREYEEENGVIRCAYCGEFTDCATWDDNPANDDDCSVYWNDTVCSHCGHNVDGSN